MQMNLARFLQHHFKGFWIHIEKIALSVSVRAYSNLSTGLSTIVLTISNSSSVYTIYCSQQISLAS